MDKYKSLKAVQGLIMSLDEQIYRFDQNKTENKEYVTLIDEYFDTIIKFLIKEVQEEK